MFGLRGRVPVNGLFSNRRLPAGKSGQNDAMGNHVDMGQRHIVALGGGGFSDEPENPLLDEYILSLSKAERPKVCFIPTASGDAPDYLLAFYRAYAGFDCEATDLQLFRRTVGDIEAFLYAQDIVFIGGGNTANMLAIWRLHGVDRALVEAWKRGVVMSGVSAGAMCWFEGSVTDSFGEGLARLDDGLGVLEGSCCPHYDGEALREPVFKASITAGLAGGFALDDGAAAHFVGTELHACVSSRAGARARRVTASGEETLPVRFLGA